MHSVLDPLRDPVASKGDEHNQADDFSRRTPTCATFPRASWIRSSVVGFILNVYRHESDREPGAKRQSNEATDRTNQEHVAESFRDIHRLLKNNNAEGNPRYPAYEADDTEDSKYNEHHRG